MNRRNVPTLYSVDMIYTDGYYYCFQNVTKHKRITTVQSNDDLNLSHAEVM